MVRGPQARELAEAARRRFLEVVPDATVRLRPGWGLIGYNAPAYFAFIVPHEEQVRYVTIRSMEDPGRLALAVEGVQVHRVLHGAAPVEVRPRPHSAAEGPHAFDFRLQGCVFDREPLHYAAVV